MSTLRDLDGLKRKINPGQQLPGCSFPVHGLDACAHAFPEFTAVLFDGLTPSARNSLAESFTEVIRSLSHVHQSGFVYGRIRSSSFHNRGGSAAPAATLWVDWNEAAELDAVHAGDDEAMYWLEDRIETAREPRAVDDWYAFGVVLCEACLSSESVRKIWDVSETPSDFKQKLRSNLRSSKSNRRLASVAWKLVEAASSGQVETTRIAWCQDRLHSIGRSAKRFPQLAVAIGGVLLAGLAVWSLVEKETARDKLTAANQRLLELESELERAATTRPSPPVIATPVVEPQPQLQLPEDRLWWSEAVLDRPLEEALELASTRDGEVCAQWRRTLSGLATLRGQLEWRQRDAATRRLVQKCVNEPWESKHLLDATERLTSLTEAYDRWRSWARSRRTMQEIREQHSLMRSGLSKDVLGEWISEVLELREFELKVIAVQNEGDWKAHLVGFETESDSASERWSWETDDDKGAVYSMEVEQYRAGQSLEFWIQQDGTVPLWNTTVIELTLENPLLVWSLSRGIRHVNSESGYAVSLSTSKRVGPPPVLTESGEKGEAQSAQPREVVDPRDLLPL